MLKPYPHEETIEQYDITKYYVLAMLLNPLLGALRILRYHQLFGFTYSDVLLVEEDLVVSNDQHFILAVAPICHSQSNLIYTLVDNFTNRAGCNFLKLLQLYPRECAQLQAEWKKLMAA